MYVCKSQRRPSKHRLGGPRHAFAADMGCNVFIDKTIPDFYALMKCSYATSVDWPGSKEGIRYGRRNEGDVVSSVIDLGR